MAAYKFECYKTIHDKDARKETVYTLVVTRQCFKNVPVYGYINEYDIFVRAYVLKHYFEYRYCGWDFLALTHVFIKKYFICFHIAPLICMIDVSTLSIKSFWIVES